VTCSVVASSHEPNWTEGDIGEWSITAAEVVDASGRLAHGATLLTTVSETYLDD
jgi:hypothetical protein